MLGYDVVIEDPAEVAVVKQFLIEEGVFPDVEQFINPRIYDVVEMELSPHLCRIISEVYTEDLDITEEQYNKIRSLLWLNHQVR